MVSFGPLVVRGLPPRGRIVAIFAVTPMFLKDVTFVELTCFETNKVSGELSCRMMLRLGFCVLAISSMASAFIPSSSGPMSSLRLGGKRATSSRLASMPLSKGLRMTLALPPLGQLEDLDGKIPDCPSTIWNAENINLAAEQVESDFR